METLMIKDSPPIDEMKLGSMLSAFGNKFTLGHIRRLEGGRNHGVFQVHNMNGRSYVFRIAQCDDADGFIYEGKMHRHLLAHGVSTPGLVMSDDGEALHYLKDESGLRYPALLLEFVPGGRPESESDLFNVGKELAKLHKVPIPLFARSTSGFNLDYFRSKIIPLEIRSALDFDLDSLMTSLAGAYDNTKLTLCHGAPYNVNLVINDSQVFLLDLETVGKDMPWMDVGMALLGNVTPQNTEIDLNKVNALLDGYSTNKPLSSNDRLAAMRAAALAGVKIAIWRFEYWVLLKKNIGNSALWKDSVRSASNWFRISGIQHVN